MRKKSRIILVLAAVIAVPVVFEIAKSWISERSGPFRVLGSSGVGATRGEKATYAIKDYFAVRRSAVEGIAFLTKAGFTCDRPWANSLIDLGQSRFPTQVTQATVCHYEFGTYFLWYQSYFVTLMIGPDGYVVDNTVDWGL